MTKDELKKEAEEGFKNIKYPTYDKDIYIQAYLASAEPREKRIAELEDKLTQKVTLESLDIVSGKIKQLEQENERLILGNKSLSEKLMNTTREKLDLQKENAELKSELSKVCGIKGCAKLTKAKEIIKKLLRLWNDVMTEETVKALTAEAENFLKDSEVEK